jgi:hypothetical protein
MKKYSIHIETEVSGKNISPAQNLQKLCCSRGFNTTTLKSGKNTSKEVLAALNFLTSKVEVDDVVLVTYYGHGGVDTTIKVPCEPDGYNEYWEFSDGKLLDDQIDKWINTLPACHLFFINESCYSGGFPVHVYFTFRNLMRTWKLSRCPDKLNKPALLIASASETEQTHSGGWLSQTIVDEMAKASPPHTWGDLYEAVHLAAKSTIHSPVLRELGPIPSSLSKLHAL